MSKSWCEIHNTFPVKGEPCWQCANPLIEKAYQAGLAAGETALAEKDREIARRYNRHKRAVQDLMLRWRQTEVYAENLCIAEADRDYWKARAEKAERLIKTRSGIRRE